MGADIHPLCGGVVAEPVKVRRLTDQEGQRLQQIVRRGSTSSVRYRRAMMLLASAGGNRVPVIAQLVAADEDTVRDVVHRFNEIGPACLDPQWAGGRPRQLSPDDEDFVVQTATTRPTKFAQPFTHWSIRKLAAYLRRVHGRVIRIGREALRCLLTRRGVTFQRTKTWKESTDPDRDAKLDRIEHVLDRFPDRVFAFDEFGPLGIRPTGGSCWAEHGRPDRLPATYHRTHGVTYFHGCYSIGDDTLWGVSHRRKGTANTLAALKSIRAARPDGAPVYVIMDNLSAHKGAKIRQWARKNKVELCFTPTNASWPTRSRRTSGRCGSSPWRTRTTLITQFRPVRCTPTCAGAMPTPVTPTYWPPNVASAHASAARKACAGADDPLPPHDHATWRSVPVAASLPPQIHLGYVTRLPTGHGPPPWSSHVDRLSLRVRTLRCRSSRWRGG
jgi:transposase